MTSFEERIVWLTLMSLILTFTVYFFLAARMLSAGVTLVIAYAPLFAVVVIALVLIMTAGAIIATIGSRPHARDERDRLIEWRAESNSGWILATGVVAALFGLTVSVGNVWIAHVLLGSLVVSEIVKAAMQLLYYRRGV